MDVLRSKLDKHLAGLPLITGKGFLQVPSSTVSQWCCTLSGLIISGGVSRGLKAAPLTCTDPFRERPRGKRTLQGATKHPITSGSQRTTGFPSALLQKTCSLVGLSQMLSEWSNAYFLFFLDADKRAGCGQGLLLTFLLSYVFCVVSLNFLRVIQRL